MGLLGVIRMQDPDLTTLALGTDLTGLGLHLNSPENVYSTFASPWAEQPLKAEPEFLVSSAGTSSKTVSCLKACISYIYPADLAEVSHSPCCMAFLLSCPPRCDLPPAICLAFALSKL